MNEFYLLEFNRFNDKYFAYTEPINQNIGSNYPRCPECGCAIGPLEWLEPRQVAFSKPKYGDFHYGNETIVSENFKNAYEKSELKGIIEFLPVNITKVKYSKGNPIPDFKYYIMRLVRSLARIDLEKSKVFGQKIERTRCCNLCNPFRTTKDEINGLYINDTGWKGESIFQLYEMGSIIFISQEFVDFCIRHNFKNFRCINTKDYQELFNKKSDEFINRNKIIGNQPF